MSATAEIIKRYNVTKTSGGGNLEFEIRIKDVTKTIFSTVITNAIKTDKFDRLDHSLDAITPDITSRLSKKIRTIRLNPFSEVYTRKSKITRVQISTNIIDYTLNIASEKPIEEFKSSSDAIARLKSRLSFVNCPTDGWRLDVTAVRQSRLSDIGPHLKSITAETFKATGLHDYMDSIDFSNSQLEIELEYISTEDLTQASVDSVLEKLQSWLSESYSGVASIKAAVESIAVIIMPTTDLFKFKRQGSGIRSLLTQAYACTVITYNNDIIPAIKMSLCWITEKADGTRAIAHLSGKAGSLTIISDKIATYPYKGSAELICDAELIEDKLLLFDVLYAEKVMTSLSFMERIASLDAYAASISEVFPAVAKKFILLSEDKLAENYKKVLDAKYGYDIDGMMFVIDGANYALTQWLKWKPLSHNTIDFMSVKLDKKHMGKGIYTCAPNEEMYALFVGINENMRISQGLEFMPHYKHLLPDKYMDYKPIQFCPSAQPNDYLWTREITEDKPSGFYDGKILEMRKQNNRIEDKWELVRLREDRRVDLRYFGNDYRVAELTYQNFITPLDREQLVDTDAKGYFKKIADADYKAKNGFFRFVISNGMKMFTRDIVAAENSPLTSIDTAIDLAAGRGGDAHRFSECGVRRVLFVDRDALALSELISRKYSGKKSPNNPMTTLILEQDLIAPAATIVKNIEKFNIYSNTVNYINCSFAIHYFCESTQQIGNFFKVVASMLAIGGYFTATTMWGERVHEKLKDLPTGGTWDLGSEENPKYSIRKLYKSKNVGFGDKIEVKLPFADEMYEEPLALVDNIIKSAKVHGLEAVLCKSFDEFDELFGRANVIMHKSLDASDKEYAKIHVLLGFKKTIAKKNL